MEDLQKPSDQNKDPLFCTSPVAAREVAFFSLSQVLPHPFDDTAVPPNSTSWPRLYSVPTGLAPRVVLASLVPSRTVCRLFSNSHEA